MPCDTAAQLRDQIADFVEQLVQATDVAHLSETLTRYLDFAAGFYHYSLNNQFLIWMARPDAVWVAGYRSWQKRGRYVRQGEKGIPILAPVCYRVRDDVTGEPTDEIALCFKVVYVFYVSQTDGRPLPAPPDWKSPQKSAELQTRLLTFAASQGI